MPTAAREVYDNATYHIVQRGNNRQSLFREEEDNKKLLSLIKRYKGVFEFDVYNYCLMRNHLHILLKVTCAGELAKIMQGIFQTFRFYIRRKYKYSGYLYQGRYKSKLIDRDAYLLECARYIERNPLRAGIVTDLRDYKWSSYLFYAYGHEDSLITPNPMYVSLSKTPYKRKKLYQEYVLQPRTYENILDKELKIR